MKRIRVAAPAERDLDEIWYYTAKTSGSTEIANGVIDSITEAFSLFARAPQAGTLRPEIEEGLRGFPAGRYIIYYRESGRFVIIARVIHGMRDQVKSYSNQ
jgi:toxin ParE1/3/4